MSIVPGHVGVWGAFCPPKVRPTLREGLPSLLAIVSIRAASIRVASIRRACSSLIGARHDRVYYAFHLLQESTTQHINTAHQLTSPMPVACISQVLTLCLASRSSMLAPSPSDSSHAKASSTVAASSFASSSPILSFNSEPEIVLLSGQCESPHKHNTISGTAPTLSPMNLQMHVIGAPYAVAILL